MLWKFALTPIFAPLAPCISWGEGQTLHAKPQMMKSKSADSQQARMKFAGSRDVLAAYRILISGYRLMSEDRRAIEFAQQAMRMLEERLACS